MALAVMLAARPLYQSPPGATNRSLPWRSRAPRATAGEEEGGGDGRTAAAGLGVGQGSAELAEGTRGREVDRDVGGQVSVEQLLQGACDRGRAAGGAEERGAAVGREGRALRAV